MELPAARLLRRAAQGAGRAGEVDVALVDRSVRRVLALKESLGLFEQPYVDEDAAAAAYGPAGRPRARARSRREVARAPEQRRSAAARAGDAPRGDRSRRRRRAPAPGRLLVPGAHRDRAAARRRDGHPDRRRAARSRPGPYYPESRHAARRHPRPRSNTSTYAQGLRPPQRAHRPSSTSAAAARRATPMSSVCCRRRRVGADARLHERRVPRRHRPRPARRAAPARRGRRRDRHADGRRRPERARRTRLPWIAGHAVALVYAWCPGEQGGAASPTCCSATSTPSGRLPISLPRSVGQIPVHHDHRAGGGRSQISATTSTRPPRRSIRSASGSRTRRSSTTSSRSSDATHRRRRSRCRSACATPANAPAPRSCSSTCATRSPASLGPATQLAGFARVDLEPGATRRGRVHGRPDRARLLRRGDAARRSNRAPCASWSAPLSATVALEGAEREIAPNDRRATAVALRDS